MRQAQVDALVQESEVEPVLVLARALRPQIVVSLGQIGRDARLAALGSVDEIPVTGAEENDLIESVNSAVDGGLAACLPVRQTQLPETEGTGLIGVAQRIREDPRQARLREVVTTLGGAERREPIVADSHRQE